MTDSRPTELDRVEVAASPTTIGVTLRLGDVVVTVTPPAPASLREISEDQARATVLRQARRALDVARDELS